MVGIGAVGGTTLPECTLRILTRILSLLLSSFVPPAKIIGSVALEVLGSISELQEENRREMAQHTPGRAPCGRFVVTVHLSSNQVHRRQHHAS